jgi:hypothetical protein
MNKLTDKQVDYIFDQVNKSQIDSEELKEDLVDHFCCVIEDNLRHGGNFEESYEKAYRIICPNGLDEIYQESIFLLSPKRIKIMKKLLFVTAFIATFILMTGILFKVQHWPAGGWILLTAAVVLIFVLLPLVLLHFYKTEYSKFISYKMKYILGYLGLALLLTGGVLKFLHLPGAGWTLLISVVILNFGYLPILFYRSYKGSGLKGQTDNPSSRKQYILGLTGFALLLTGAVLKILHLPGAAVIMGIAVLVINFGFLPVFFYGLYKKTTE